MNELGKRLRELRESRNMSQVELAKALGKSQVAISKYENGNRELDYKMLENYANFFHVSTDYLLGRTEKQNEFYLSAKDYPEILKPFVDNDKSSITFRVDQIGRNVSLKDKQDCIVDFLKRNKIEDFNKPFKQLWLLLPPQKRESVHTLYELLDAVRNDPSVMTKFNTIEPELILKEPDVNEQKETPILTQKDERDISKRLDQTLSDLENAQGALMFDGEPLDDVTKELLIASLHKDLEMGKRIAKQKFTPKKYRKSE